MIIIELDWNKFLRISQESRFLQLNIFKKLFKDYLTRITHQPVIESLNL